MDELILPPNPTLADFQKYVADMVRIRGFNDGVAQRFMMLLEESGEFAKAARKHAGMKFAADTHETDLQDEAADVFIVFMVLCSELGIDLEQAFRAKEERNKQRTWK
ncbi:MAG TPA: MazG nucleotide pyrophosphohydrolase domain-containing protein [Candidatus Saccharimonadales bacterium]|nr:MazG nucleotide pyrophosphohydrolase domain-containing protein [Candidatus Saccharimonadales bacterium]